MMKAEKPRDSINEIGLLRFIEANPQRRIFVRKIGGALKFQLVKNFQGDLCYLDGLNKRLFPIDGHDFEMCEESLELMARGDTGDSAEENAKISIDHKATVKMESSIAPTTLDIHLFIKGFNSFIERVAHGEPKPAQKKAEKTYLSELSTNFKVIVPPYDPIPDLVVKYVLAITQSLNELKQSIQAGSCHVGKFRTKGMVKNLPDLAELIKKELAAANIECKFVSTNGAYSHLFAWTEQKNDPFQKG